MPEEKIQIAQGQHDTPAKKEQQPQQQFEQALNTLMKFGGIPSFESFISEIANISPIRKARRDRFFEDDKKEERKKLLRKIDNWIELLEENSSMDNMMDKCSREIEETGVLLRSNQHEAIDRVRNLERAYREMKSFYDNTGLDKVKNISIINVSHEQLTDLDNPVFIDHVANELKQNFDRLDLRDNYSLLVLPGYLGSKKVVDKWARIADEYMVQLYSDFADVDNPDDLMEMFYDSKLTGSDTYLQSTSLCCNWITARAKYDELGEEDDMRISPASALAGRIYSTLMSQVTAGSTYGTIYDADAVRFRLLKSELTKLEQMGLVPLVKEFGKVMAFSGKTLFDGPNEGRQTYSVVRVFNHVGKTSMDFFNRIAFETWDPKRQQQTRKELVRYLDSIKGSGKLIKRYEILRLERNDKDLEKHIYFDVFLEPFFPGKSYIMKMHGMKGEDGPINWNTETDEG